MKYSLKFSPSVALATTQELTGQVCPAAALLGSAGREQVRHRRKVMGNLKPITTQCASYPCHCFPARHHGARPLPGELVTHRIHRNSLLTPSLPFTLAERGIHSG